MMNPKLLAVLNAIALTFHITLSYLTQQKKFSSLDVGGVSAKYDTVFAPAGITFAIWGVIYIALTAFCIYHLIKSFSTDVKSQANVDLQSIGFLFVINNLATGFWLLSWVNEELLVSMILILIQLVTLILISVRAHISNPDRSLATKVFSHFPLSIYFGWICIATIANVSAWLVSVEWDGFGIAQSYWTVIMIGAAALISLAIILVKRNFFFGLVVLWALYGIVVKRQSVNPVQYENVINAAWAAFLIVLIAVLIRLFMKKTEDIRTKPIS